MIENTNITINANVTINSSQAGKENRQPIDRTNEVLIDNRTSFAELINILSSRPEANTAAEYEAEERAREEEEERLRRKYGEDYEAVMGCGKDEAAALKKASRRPGPVQLRTFVPRIAKKQMGEDGICEVFVNGYAIYDNGDRKTVVWVPECGSNTFYFGKLRDNEKLYQKEKEEIGEDVLGPAPWYYAVFLRGEDQIWFNMDHPMSQGTASDSHKPEEWELKADHRWACGAHFDDPETAYLRKEAAEERKNLYDGRMRQVYTLYYEESYNQREIGEILGLDRHTVNTYLRRARKKMQKHGKENIFSEV